MKKYCAPFIILFVLLSFLSQAQNNETITQNYDGTEFVFKAVPGKLLYDFHSFQIQESPKSIADELIVLTVDDIDFCFFLDKSSKSVELVSRRLNNQENLEAKTFIEENLLPITYPTALSADNKVNAQATLTFPIAEEYRGKGNSFKVYDAGRSLMTIPIKDQQFISFEEAPLFKFEIEDFNKLTYLIKKETGVLIKKF